jgi:hypothetical protein
MKKTISYLQFPTKTLQMIRLVRRAVFTLMTLRTELTRLTKTEDAFSHRRWLSYSIRVQPAVTGHGPANGLTNPERCPIEVKS